MGLEPGQGGLLWSIPITFYRALIDHLAIFHKGIHSVVWYHFDGHVLTPGWANGVQLATGAVRARWRQRQ